MIEHFIDSALIIDDKENEVKELLKLLEEKDIWVKYKNPKNCNKQFKNRKIIFLDIHLSETATELKGHISEIRKILKTIIGKEFGTYGIILWTNYYQHIDEFKEKIQQDSKQYKLPLFIIGLDKTKYIKDGYSKLFNDLNSELEKNIAANFFINWSILVNQGKDKSIDNIYSLIPDYAKQDNNLQFILFQLAKNYTGIPLDELRDYPLHIDAFKAFTDMMNYEVNNVSTNCFNIFDDKSNIKFINESGDPTQWNSSKVTEEIERIYADINTKLLLDENPTGELVIPGNIYEIVEKTNQFFLQNLPDKARPIVLEITPPCDFAQKNKSKSRIVSGLIIDFDKTLLSKKPWNKNYIYQEIRPICIKDEDSIKMILFDFRYFSLIDDSELKNNKKYKLLFRAKNKLFADILQKLSAHSARLGLSVIH